MKPEEIKAWLKQIGKDRHWLASETGFSKSTIDGWMAGRAIAKPAEKKIAEMMYGDRPIAPKFTMDEFARIQRKADSLGLTIEEFIAKATLAALSLFVMWLAFK